MISTEHHSDALPLRRLFASFISAVQRLGARGVPGGGMRMPKFAEQEIVLPPNTTAGFAVPPRGVRITCLSGTLWVTAVGDPQDYLLSAGQKFVPRSGGRLVVESMAASPARFLLQRSANRRGGRWLTPPPAEAATSVEVVA